MDDAPVVQTHGGAVRGRLHQGMAVFRGIPYATAQRFRAPAADATWPGQLDATAFGQSHRRPVDAVLPR